MIAKANQDLIGVRLWTCQRKDNGNYPANTFDAGFVEGWNQCIDEIAGGEDSDD